MGLGVGLLPESFRTNVVWDLALWQWLGLLIAAVLSYGVGRVVAGVVIRISARAAARTKADWDDRLLVSLREPGRVFMALVALWWLLEPLSLPAGARAVVHRVTALCMIAALSWTLIRMIRFVADTVEARALAGEEEDELQARGVRTQVLVLRRVASIVVGVVAASLILLQFEVVRNVGVSLLASAGIAGVVLGLAAQKSISGLLAGIQLSVTQPIRIGDTVIVEGEWGKVEEVNLTYVVVRIWDQRRLVVPIATFLEKPFQNWTKVSPELLGTIYFYADYRLPVEAVRTELDAILEGNELWDGRAKGVVVTDATDRAIQVRALVSARNAGDQWDLRCHVRERLVAWLRAYDGGRYLPRVRVDGADPAASAAAG